ncbi:hypothetical protein Tco_1370192 [Tanacetum coccineum]
MMMVVCYDDGEDGGGGSGVVEVARGASGVVDRVDRNDGESFGLRRKNPPEKFSGGGGGRRLPDMGGREERLGHPAEPVLNVLKESLQFDNKDQNDYYEICQRAKQIRELFPLSDCTSKFLDVNTADFPDNSNDANSSEDIFTT